jgi:hypothetical protein
MSDLLERDENDNEVRGLLDQADNLDTHDTNSPEFGQGSGS